MCYKTKKAFTMIELIYVIVIIGILSAVAIPKFAETTKLAHLSKAQSVVTNVMSAIVTERQKRILRGDFTSITDLGDATYAFNKFSSAQNGDQNEILAFPEKNCAAGQTACWSRTSATTYVYKFADSTEGEAKFKLDNSKLVCDNDASDCAKVLR